MGVGRKDETGCGILHLAWQHCAVPTVGCYLPTYLPSYQWAAGDLDNFGVCVMPPKGTYLQSTYIQSACMYLCISRSLDSYIFIHLYPSIIYSIPTYISSEERSTGYVHR